MAKIDLTSKDWCELIFKDRNKAYGAYDMRLDTPKRHNMATLIVVIAVILVITLPMLIKFITPERENKIVVNEVTTLAKLPEAEIKRNEELRPMMKPTTPPPPLKPSNLPPPSSRKTKRYMRMTRLRVRKNLHKPKSLYPLPT